MVIRVLDDKKADQCDELLTKLIHDESQYDDSIDNDFVVNDYFKNVIKNEDDILLAYEENETVKGYIFLKFIVDGHKKGYLIDGLYVDEPYRGLGIASNLLEKSLNVIKSKKVDYVDINSLAMNKKALNLYKKFNFKEFKIKFRINL